MHSKWSYKPNWIVSSNAILSEVQIKQKCEIIKYIKNYNKSENIQFT